MSLKIKKLVAPAVGCEPVTLKACQVFHSIRYQEFNYKGNICLAFPFKFNWFGSKEVNNSSDRIRTCDPQCPSGIHYIQYKKSNSKGNICLGIEFKFYCFDNKEFIYSSSRIRTYQVFYIVRDQILIFKINIRIGLDFEFKSYSIGKKESITAVAGIEHLTEFATNGCIHITFVKPAKNGDDHAIRKTVFKTKLVYHLSRSFFKPNF